MSTMGFSTIWYEFECVFTFFPMIVSKSKKIRVQVHMGVSHNYKIPYFAGCYLRLHVSLSIENCPSFHQFRDGNLGILKRNIKICQYIHTYQHLPVRVPMNPNPGWFSLTPCHGKHHLPPLNWSRSRYIIYILQLIYNIPWIYPPPRIPVANEGLGWDSLLKMFHNPGGDWHPGWGVDLIPIYYIPYELMDAKNPIGEESTPMTFPYNRGWEKSTQVRRGLYTHYKDSRH